MKTTHSQEIGSVIRFHRKQSGLSQQALAEMAEVGKTVVFDVEKGKPTVRMDTLLKICHVLNLRFSLEGPLMDQWRAQQPSESTHREDEEI